MLIGFWGNLLLMGYS